MPKLESIEGCVTPTLLARYYAGLLKREEADALEDHLFGCQACDALAERMADAAHETLAEMYPVERPLSFLATATVGLELAARIQRWIDVGSELAAKISIAAKSIAYSLDGLDSLVNPAGSLQLAKATGAGRSGDGARSLQGTVLSVPGLDGMSARVVVDVARRRISVGISSFPAEREAPLVALRGGGQGDVAVQQMERVDPLSGKPGVVDCRASFPFEGSPDELLILIEPLRHG